MSHRNRTMRSLPCRNAESFGPVADFVLDFLRLGIGLLDR